MGRKIMTKVNFHVKAIVFHNDGRFLALKAAYKGMRWDVPGGAVEIPEEHEVALRREIQEEAGIEVENIKPVTIETGYDKDDNVYVMFIGFTCDAVTENVVLSSEHTDSKWVTKNEFLELEATEYLKKWVEEVL
jgi:8-oxo-dGTP pyrophosphatase MutT (NUDIX family)